MSRPIYIAGNWKMNLNKSAASELSKAILKPKTDAVKVVVFPPAVFLDVLGDVKRRADNAFDIGGQNAYPADSGAFTGEISGHMLKEFGATYWLIGHSERRSIFNESADFLLKKVRAALALDLTPVFCVGEQLEERKAGKQNEVISSQLDPVLSDLTNAEFAKLVIAYEPVWAIGTGETASPEQAQEMHAFIRSYISDNQGAQIANEMPILYGGSMKPANAELLLSQADVDGGLIGGASLNAESFNEMIAIAESLKC